MFPEPRYLDLQQELYPSITLYKEFIFDNQEDGFHTQLFQRVDYDSKNRTIDLTDSINTALRKAYHTQQQLRLYVYDPLLTDFKFFAYFPNESSFTLGEQFLQTDLLIFRIKNHNQHDDEDAFDPEIDIVGVDQYDPAQLQIQEQAGAQEKSKKIKNIRELIELVDQWRKLYYQSHGKLTLEQGASILGLTRRSLQANIQALKFGEKYGYPFEYSMEKKVNELRKYVKEKSKAKKTQQMEMLMKLKNYYK